MISLACKGKGILVSASECLSFVRQAIKCFPNSKLSNFGHVVSLVYCHFACAGILIALFLARKILIRIIIILPCAVAWDTTDFKHTVISFCTKVSPHFACNGLLGFFE